MLTPGQLIQGRIQFFIDAIDSDVRNNETEFIINRFPIDLELELRKKNFIERTTYTTGIYSIPGIGFDMSSVQSAVLYRLRYEHQLHHMSTDWLQSFY